VTADGKVGMQTWAVSLHAAGQELAGRSSACKALYAATDGGSRRFRLDGLEATSLGLGLAAVGRPGYINLGRDADLGPDRSVAALAQRAHDVLDAAYGAGIRYFDAARSYGRAEEFLASWLRARQIAPGAVTVGSKWGLHLHRRLEGRRPAA
jgi:aryl-alcohol dehydrogenase-like predicted oxidoreductase